MTSTLNQRIRRFYDESSPLWLDTWGEHMHHGYYGPDGRERKDNRQAQLDLIEEMLRWGGVEGAARILDAGCGVGGSARYLSHRFGATALGLTLSPVQAERGRAFNERAGLSDRVELRVQDVLTLDPAAEGPFDLIWSMESAEHMADKRGLIELFHQVLAPGGRLLMATWCHRPEPPALTRPEQRLLGQLYELYHLPPMISINHFGKLARAAGFEQVQTDDWTAAVAPFCDGSQAAC